MGANGDVEGDGKVQNNIPSLSRRRINQTGSVQACPIRPSTDSRLLSPTSLVGHSGSILMYSISRFDPPNESTQTGPLCR